MASDQEAETGESGPRSKPSLRELQKQFTHERLLEAAIVVFARKGYIQATIDDIALEAEVNRGTVYLHFKNKRDVSDALSAALRPSAEATSALLDEALASGSRDTVRDWLRNQLDWFEAHRGTVIALEHVVLEGGFEAAGLDSIYLDAMPRLTERWGASRRDELRMRLWMLVSVLARIFFVRRVDGLLEEIDEELIIDLLAELWMDALYVGRELGPALGVSPSKSS